MKYRHIFVSALVFISAPAGLGYAKDYDAPVVLPDRAVIVMTFTRRGNGEGLGDAAGKGIIFQYRQGITRTQSGYQVHQTLVQTDFPPEISPATKSMIEQGAEFSRDIVYDADEALAPVRIPDWQNRAASMVQTMERLMGPSPQAQTAIAALQQRFLSMTPEQGVALLKEQNLVALAQGLTLDLNQPVSVDTQMDNPLGGSPIKGTLTLSLESWDKSKNEAYIHIHQELDPESLGQSAREMLLANGGRSKEAEAALAGIKANSVLDCRAQIDTATGLATDTNCVSTVTGMDRDLKPRQRTDQWHISQALVKRP